MIRHPLGPFVVFSALGCAACGGLLDPTLDVSRGADGACVTDGSSSLPGAAIDFPSPVCTFTQGQAQAGITIPYRLVITSATPSVVPRPQDAGHCGSPGPSGLIVFEDLSGGGHRYCLCDTGLCSEPPDTLVTIPQGTYPGTFTWHGRSWSGPADTDRPEGEPFPPGDYLLNVSATGTQIAPEGQQPFSVVGTLLIKLLPI